MTRGQVKWFDPKKGYGFIIGPEGQDVFVHYSHIDAEGFKALKNGEYVDYELVQGEKGWQARAVRGTGEAGEVPGGAQEGGSPESAPPRREQPPRARGATGYSSAGPGGGKAGGPGAPGGYQGGGGAPRSGGYSGGYEGGPGKRFDELDES